MIQNPQSSICYNKAFTDTMAEVSE